MALLISPSNNSGWGLGVKSMYGGARRRSATHTVRVKSHYRQPWGAVKRGRRPAPAGSIERAIEAAIGTPSATRAAAAVATVARAARVIRGRRRRRRGFGWTRRRRGPRIRYTRRI